MTKAQQLIQESKSKRIEKMAKDGINSRDTKGCTALLKACEEGLSDLAMDLIRKGADINMKDSSGRTPLSIALEKGNDALAISLISNGANMSVLYQSNLLTSQFFKSHPQFVKFLSGNGASGDTLSNHSLLIFTSDKNGAEAIEAYIANGGYVNAVNSDGKSCLSLVSEVGNVDAARTLIENGANVDYQDKKGRTATMNFAKQANLDGLKLMIEKKADLNLQDEDGNTALLLIAKAKNVDKKEQQEGIMVLIKNGIDLTIRNKKDEDFVTALIKNGQADTLKRIIEEHCEKESVEHKSDSKAKEEKVSHETKTEKEQNTRETGDSIEDKNQDTTIKKKNISVKDFINGQDVNGNTPLMHACENKRIEVIKCLAEAGANLFIKNNEGLNVIDIVNQRIIGDDVAKDTFKEEAKNIINTSLMKMNSPEARIYQTRIKTGKYDKPIEAAKKPYEATNDNLNTLAAHGGRNN